jgi:hypothetical protein
MTIRGTPTRSARPAFRLHRTAFKTVLILHVLTSVGWFGLATAVVFFWVTARATADQGLARALYVAIAELPWISVPAGLAAAVTGAMLGLGTRYGLVKYWWVTGKILIAAAVLITDGTLTGALAHAAAVNHTSEPVLYGSTSAHAVVLVLASVLSVFKPAGRTPWVRRSQLGITFTWAGDSRPAARWQSQGAMSHPGEQSSVGYKKFGTPTRSPGVLHRGTLLAQRESPQRGARSRC